MDNVAFLETHGEIFCGGKNHGKKHRPKPQLGLQWDEKKGCAFLSWNGETARIFPSNINVLVERGTGDGAIPIIENKTHAQDTKKIKGAQVSTPMGHVFEGPGAGKTK